MKEVLGPAEIASRLGISVTRVHQLVREDRTFPAPVQELAMGRVWDVADIVKWAKRAGRVLSD